jgi:hypothetical protein
VEKKRLCRSTKSQTGYKKEKEKTSDALVRRMDWMKPAQQDDLWRGEDG